MSSPLKSQIQNPESPKKHIVLFGGAFNPPHIGHLIVIQQAFELIKEVDEIWLLPCYSHTFNKMMVSPTQRLAMATLLINELPSDVKAKVKVCPIEIDFKLSGQTIEAIGKLKTETDYLVKLGLMSSRESCLENRYSFLMGSDNVKSFKRWSRWQDLIKLMHFYIYPRSGQLPHKLYENMTLLESDTQIITNFSSTIMRERIELGLPLQNFIPTKILEYIEANDVYVTI